MSADDRQLDAAEYVMGTLSSTEKAVFETQLSKNQEVRQEVRYWERVFGTLSAIISPVAPPAEVWSRIEKMLPDDTNAHSSTTTGGPSLAAANDNRLVTLRRSRGRWRLAALAATVAALGFGGLMMNERFGLLPGLALPGGPGGQEYIAVVQSDAKNPALIVKVNGRTRNVTVRQLGVSTPSGKSLEVWYIPAGTQNVVSVGLVGEGEIDLKDLPTGVNDTIAISLEPKGGSPTGVATGPIIYSGKLIEDVDAQ